MYTTDKETGLADLGRRGLCGGAVQSSGLKIQVVWELCYDPGRGCSHVTVSTAHLLRTDTRISGSYVLPAELSPQHRQQCVLSWFCFLPSFPLTVLKLIYRLG